jgi:hypothetical protein
MLFIFFNQFYSIQSFIYFKYYINISIVNNKNNKFHYSIKMREI